MKKRYPATNADIFLGETVKSMRIKRGMTPKQLGKKVNETLQTIDKFEEGKLIPISKLEEIAIALDLFIQKKLIRKIMRLRKLPFQTKESQAELIELYRQSLEEQPAIEYE